jgi:hypothetical protein
MVFSNYVALARLLFEIVVRGQSLLVSRAKGFKQEKAERAEGHFKLPYLRCLRCLMFKSNGCLLAFSRPCLGSRRKSLISMIISDNSG